IALRGVEVVDAIVIGGVQNFRQAGNLAFERDVQTDTGSPAIIHDDPAEHPQAGKGRKGHDRHRATAARKEPYAAIDSISLPEGAGQDGASLSAYRRRLSSRVTTPKN